MFTFFSRDSPMMTVWLFYRLSQSSNQSYMFSNKIHFLKWKGRTIQRKMGQNTKWQTYYSHPLKKKNWGDDPKNKSDILSMLFIALILILVRFFSFREKSTLSTLSLYRATHRERENASMKRKRALDRYYGAALISISDSSIVRYHRSLKIVKTLPWLLSRSKWLLKFLPNYRWRGTNLVHVTNW